MGGPLEEARQQRAGLRAAIGRVERALSSAATGRVEAWSAELRTELDNLSTALEQHIEITEAPDGLLADIAAAVPRLAKRVERTRQDHLTLRESLERTRKSLTGEDESVHDARDRVVELLTALVRHRHLGADLVYEAYNVDIEAAD
jgi:chromosome segregation ATPase